MLLEDLKKKRSELGYSYQRLAELSGLPLSTVQKIMGGITRTPRSSSLEKLEKALFPEKDSDEIRQIMQMFQGLTPASGVFETKAIYNAAASLDQSRKPGEYTLDDYYALPDDVRVELIDGVFFYMDSPSSPHQLIAGEIFAQLRNFRVERKAACLPVISPIGVQLDRDNKTMVEPDIIILCDRSKLINRCVYGAPDFVVEILSPSTRRKDIILKSHKYADAGVREYWIVDIEAKKILVYDFEHEKLPAIYGFDDSVPVMIWNNECSVDFKDISELIDTLFL